MTEGEPSTPYPSPGSGMKPVIEVYKVNKNFGPTRALIDVSMTVSEGEARALIGRNGAGKSTLVSLLSGMLLPSSGDIKIHGRSALDASSVSCVYQHSRLVQSMTVAENIVMSRYPRHGGRIDWNEVNRFARAVLDPWNLAHLANRRVEEIAPVQKKVVEICRALAEKPSVLMLDEPTAGLDRQDAEQLFEYIDKLKQDKVTLIYVSHHLDEIYRFCGSVTVLRDSRVVVTSALSALPKADLIEAMMGQAEQVTASRRADAPNADQAEIGLSVRNLKVGKVVKDFSLDVRRGECVGVAGLEGSGKAEIGAAIAGLILPTGGSVKVGSRSYPLGDVAAAIEAGIGYVPENRNLQGMVLTMSVAENSTMTAFRRLSRSIIPGVMRILLPSVLRQEYGKLARQWSIRSAGPSQLISELSGGNQQKCVMARALATRPNVLVLQNPTAGVDVAAKASIMRSLDEILSQGASIVVISEDADDFSLASRIVVVNHGRLGSQLGAQWTDTQLVAAMQDAQTSTETITLTQGRLH